MAETEVPVFESFVHRITRVIEETEQLALDTTASNDGPVAVRLLSSLQTLRAARIAAIQKYGADA